MSASFAYEDPLLRQQTQAGMNTTQKASQIFKEMGRGMWSSGKGFGKVGALFAGIECCIEGVCYIASPTANNIDISFAHSTEPRTISGIQYHLVSLQVVSLQRTQVQKLLLGVVSRSQRFQRPLTCCSYAESQQSAS